MNLTSSVSWIVNMINDSERTADCTNRNNNHLPFSDYITGCRAIIKERRIDLQPAGSHANLIIDANSPFELYPSNPIHSVNRLKYGVLLLHGLLDCPYSLKDLGKHLQANGILCRSILLPGHGTTPEDLLSVSYQDWIKAVRYGVDSLSKEVDHIYLAGYSTGAALSVHEALQSSHLSGIILIAPAIRIKIPINLVVSWHYLKRWLHINHNQWIDKVKEIDYAKYLSIPFNAVNQVSKLTDVVRDLRQQRTLTCPIFMAVSREDETISSQKAIHFFSGLNNPRSQLLLYANTTETIADKRIHVRTTQYPDLNIKHFSHVALPYAPNNPHYGQHGDYLFASNQPGFLYGAFSRVEYKMLNRLHQLKLSKNKYRQLTYNPDFDYMADEITRFIKG